MDARGAIVGLTRGTSREMLVRATLESLAYQTRDVVESMQRDSGIRLRELRVDGGAARNNWLMQFQADLLGIPVARPSMIANTGKGAALLAGIGLGWWMPRDVAAFVGKPERIFHPRMKPADRHRLYAGWQEAVARVWTKKV
jgi:glycerol kinase